MLYSYACQMVGVYLLNNKITLIFVSFKIYQTPYSIPLPSTVRLPRLSIIASIWEHILAVNYNHTITLCCFFPIAQT